MDIKKMDRKKITITKEKEIMVKCNEKVNEQIARKLATMSLGQYMECMKIVNKKNEIQKHQIEYEMITNYCKEQVKCGFEMIREYSPSEASPEGRKFVKGTGLQSISKVFRGPLSDEIYTDFDMINAHPNILKWYCIKNSIDCFCLQDYIRNREDKLKSLMKTDKKKREDAKTLFLVSLNENKKIKGIKNEFFNSFDQEMKKIQKIIRDSNKKLSQDVKNSRGNHNIEGRTVNRILCKYENEILMKARNKFGSNCLCFDGFMLETDDEDAEDIIEQLNELTSDYGVKWDAKEHDTRLTETILSFKESESSKNVFSYSAEDIISLAEQIIRLPFSKNLFSCKGEYFFRSSRSSRWLKDEKVIRNEIHRWIVKNDLYIEDKKVTSQVRWVKETVDEILNLCNQDDKFMDKLWADSIYKICFSNGYYDFKKMEFIDNYDELKTLNFIDRRCLFVSNSELRKEIYEKILKPTFGETLDHFLYRLSRVMAGHIEDKRWFLLTGFRDSGKGVICSLLNKTFGFYIGTTNSGNLIYKENDKGDEAKKNSWMMDYVFKRLAITNEISMDFKSKNSIDGNMIKKFCSGGDVLSGRKNFQDETEFKVQSSLMICCNDIPEFKPTDCLEKKDEYNLLTKFYQGEMREEDKIPGYNYIKADDKIKTDFIERPEVHNEFFLILLDAYKKGAVQYPEHLLKELKQEDSGEMDEAKLLKEGFKLDAQNFISNKDIGSFLRTSSFSYSLVKAKKILKKFYPNCDWSARNGTSRGVKGLCFSESDSDDF